MPTKTIIHGHFYQPPREDPWIDQIEEQPSAHPYKNWNERIARECYIPNCFSRVLDANGKIKDIVNNYQYISFNFGPTLLNWLEKNEKETYDLIIEADKKSIIEHNGHGNAIAQIYNHVIMPLQSYEDKKTQVIWGLKDFEKRFGRKSEGIWLSETAINYDTVDLLIEHGIKFVILSPQQAQGFRKLNEHKWTDVSETAISTRAPYKIIRNHGEITVFFFDKRLSIGVSFEHLLHDADNFATRINQSETSKDDLIIIATDGEVYGHHEPFGDMCLAKLIKEYHLANNKIQLLNFGECLDLYPAQYEVSLNLGDDGKGSSWSCAHGVGRWYRDCGCHTGGQHGWNQKWRTPLREAFDSIKIKIDEIYVREISRYINNPWDLRNDYIEFLLADNDYTKLDFLSKRLVKKIDEDEKIFILALLESQKNAMFMYTSCAWFFTELTGIETVQNIKYAYRSIYLLGNLGNDLKILLEDKLKLALSNIQSYKNGRWVLENWIYPYVQDLQHIANNFIVLLNTENTGIENNRFEIFKKYSYENFNIKKIKNDELLYEGSIKIIDNQAYSYKNFFFIYKILQDKNYKIFICKAEDKESFKKLRQDILNNDFNTALYHNIYTLSEKDLLGEIKKFIIEYNYHDKIEEMINSMINLFKDLKPLLNHYKTMNISLPDIYKSFLKFASVNIFYNYSRVLKDFPTREILLELIDLFEYTNHFSIKPDSKNIKDRLSEILYENLSKQDIPLDSEIYRKAIILMEFCHKVNLIIEKSKSENLVYKLLKNNTPILIDKINSCENEEERAKYMLQLRNLIILAENFNINTDLEKSTFFERFKDLNTMFSSGFLK